jgi:hypothetical protein
MKTIIVINLIKQKDIIKLSKKLDLPKNITKPLFRKF